MGEQREKPEELAEWSTPPFWERAVALVGALMFAGLLAYLFIDAVWGDVSPPDIEAAVEAIENNGQDYVVTFVTRNVGGRTASQVLVRGRLMRDGELLEEAEATFAYIPSGSERRGGLFFRENPRQGTIELLPSGYVDP